MARRPLVLRFASAHGSLLPELEWFAKAVATVSAGAIEVRFVRKWPLAHDPREETVTIEGVTENLVDLGWAGTRAFGCLGVRALDPLQAPFLLESYGALDAVCRDPVTQEMLEPLSSLGLVGLAVLPGPQRKPFAFARRLVAPRDFVGAKLRIHESLVAETTYSALGAEAVVLSVPEMASRPDALVDGLDIQTEALAAWGLRGSITYNVNLWPRTLAIVASRKAYDWLGEAERAALHEAAALTLERALRHLETQEERDREAVPPDVNPIYADDDQLRELRERVLPAYEELQRLPETAGFLERVVTIAERAGNGAGSAERAQGLDVVARR